MRGTATHPWPPATAATVADDSPAAQVSAPITAARVRNPLCRRRSSGIPRGPSTTTSADFSLDKGLYHADLEEMLTALKPQAVLIYSNTKDHRKIVELCAKHHIPVMMEKPLAVSTEDALAIEKAAHEAKIPVLVNILLIGRLARTRCLIW